MRTIFITLAIITALLGLALSILPFGEIAFIPIFSSFVFGIFAYRISHNKGTTIIKITFLVSIIALALSIYNTLKPNEIVEDQEQIKLEIQSEEEDLEELEDLDIE